MSGCPIRQRGPLPQYSTKEIGAPTAIDSATSCSISCGSAGCSRLNAQVLKALRTLAASGCLSDGRLRRARGAAGDDCSGGAATVDNVDGTAPSLIEPLRKPSPRATGVDSAALTLTAQTLHSDI